MVHRQDIEEGITHSRRLTLSDGVRTHDAHYQTVDVRSYAQRTPLGVELYFRDSYRFNIAAYRLARVLGLDNVPVSVERRLDGEAGAITWWVDDVLMNGMERWKNRVSPPDRETWTQQVESMRVFDALIANTDRNLGNMVITRNWRLWMVDHTRAFRRHRYLHHQKLLTRCDRRLLNALRDTSEEEISEALLPWIELPELEALLARRDQLVAHFAREIEKRGEAAVLYDARSRESEMSQAENRVAETWRLDEEPAGQPLSP